MRKRGITGITGVSDSRTAWVISKLIREEGGQALILTATEGRAKSLAADLSFFEKEREILIMPNEDQVFLHFEARSNKAMMERLRGLKELRANPNAVVISPVSAALKRLMPHRKFESRNMEFRIGSSCDLRKTEENLTALGYKRNEMTEVQGEFSIRGGILDVFPPGMENPVRIEFFDTEVDSVRMFDQQTQRSVKNLKEVEIGPAEPVLADPAVFSAASQRVDRAYSAQISKLSKKGAKYSQAVEQLEKTRDMLCEYIENVSNIQLLDNYLHYFYPDPEYLWDYLAEGNIFVEDPDRIMEFLGTRRRELHDDFELMLERGQAVPEDEAMITGAEDFLKIYEHTPVWTITPFPKPIKGVENFDQLHDYHSRQMASFNGKLDILAEEVRAYQKKQYTIHITAGSPERLNLIRDSLKREGITDGILYEEGTLSSGMDLPEQRICYITENDVFAEKRKRARKKRRAGSIGQPLDAFTDLKKGDYVVHESHGIGKFLGIQHMNLKGGEKDYLKIKYAGTDILYVPVEQFDIIQKYIGNEAREPKLNKLAGTEWKITKARARKVIAEMADDLIHLYAEREVEEGYAFPPDSEEQQEFENQFPYWETEDQLRAAAEIKEDMEKKEPMDRLLCGDVGFGKTEVACRAVFKCVAAGKQAAILVPTTLLANQHYYTIQSRFAAYPFRVEMLSRFRSAQEQKKIIEDVRAGKVDIIIGTHRLLSKDVVFKDLGLLVVDEEQRFGVDHKEKIKIAKKNVDVLTLSATPIPRTLNMSLNGIKNISLITEPPEERYPVQTYVMEQDDAVIREAILRETERGGQVFVIYNRVRGINQIAERIRTLVPEVSVCVGHGKMNEQTLEEIMLRFIEKEYDVLVATTIIESGIDIQNANTLIVLDADRFGLAQLYQIRGRVGRSNRIAYAYLMYQKDKVLTTVAEKRLRAVREFTEFGSGFKVAMRDLEIRGAGNLLGSEQSGQIMNIGYELYCKLVDEEVRKLKGEKISDDPKEASVELTVSANIPDWYIRDEVTKLEVYKKIANVRNDEQEDDLLDELVDRFGDVPRETRNLIKVSRIRGLAENLSVDRIYEQNSRIICSFAEKNALTAEGIVRANDLFKGRVFVHGGNPMFVRIPLRPRTKLEDSLKLLEVMKGEENAVQKDYNTGRKS